MKKTCSKCKRSKDQKHFTKNNASKDGLYSACRECCKIYRKENYKHIYERIQKWNKENTEKKRSYSKKYYEKNKNHIDNKHKKHYEKNKDDYKKRCERYRKLNKDVINKKIRQKRRRDIQFRLRSTLRSRLNVALKYKTEKGSAVRDLGCTIEELMIHLESQFYNNKETGEEMSWKNYGLKGWHIDHILPLYLFDLTKREELLAACHVTNLQPLWAKENWSKR